jgi:hypothetical protein
LALKSIWHYYLGEYLRARLIEKAKELASERLSLLAGTVGCYGVGFLGIHDGPGADFVSIYWSTRNTQPLPHSEMIRSHLPLTIRGFCLCLTTHKLSLILAGRFRLRNGEPCFRMSSRENRAVALRVITAYHMRRSGECCVPLVATKWDV